MSSDLIIGPGREWNARGGLFDYVLEAFAETTSDEAFKARLHEFVKENLGSQGLWLRSCTAAQADEMKTWIRDSLISTAERDSLTWNLTPEERRQVLEHLRELATLADDNEWIPVVIRFRVWLLGGGDHKPEDFVDEMRAFSTVEEANAEAARLNQEAADNPSLSEVHYFVMFARDARRS
jgi:hypothetical protein